MNDVDPSGYELSHKTWSEISSNQEAEIERLTRELSSAQACCDSYATENQQFHDRFTAAEASLAEARAGQVWGFYEEKLPIYCQGPAVSELQNIVTAKECNVLVEKLCGVQAALRQADEVIENCSAAFNRDELWGWYDKAIVRHEGRKSASWSSPVTGSSPSRVRFTPYLGKMDGAEQTRMRQHPLYQSGDTVLVWVNEGDLYTAAAERVAPQNTTSTTEA